MRWFVLILAGISEMKCQTPFYFNMKEKKIVILKFDNALLLVIQTICAISIVFMVIMMMIVVIGRYFFNNIPSWSEEFSLFFMSWLAFFGAVVIEREKGHIRVSFFDKYYPLFLLRLFSVVRYLIKLFFLVHLTYFGTWIVFHSKDKFASVDLNRGWFFLPGAVAGFAMFCIQIINFKEELIDIWHSTPIEEGGNNG